MNLSQLNTLAVRQNVTVSVKVVSVTAGETLKTKGGKRSRTATLVMHLGAVG